MPARSRSLIARLAAWPDTPGARRPATGWSDDPVLSAQPNPGTAALAARSDPAVLAALATRPTDPTATLAALAALAPGLAAAHRRWHSVDPDETEADLLAEALGALRTIAERGANAVAARAADRVRNHRRTAARRVARMTELDDATGQQQHHRPDPLALVVAGHRTGHLTTPAAQVLWAGVAGWSSAEAGAMVGCSPAAWRVRRSRTLRALRTFADDTGVLDPVGGERPC